VVLKKTLESPLDCKEIQPAHPKGDQPWDFFGRNDAKAETPVLLATSCKELLNSSWSVMEYCANRLLVSSCSGNVKNVTEVAVVLKMGYLG